MYADQETPPLPLQFTGISRGAVEDDGGQVVDLEGLWASTPASVTVTVGATPHPCYSGQSGNGYRPRAQSPTRLSFVVPPLPIGGPYDIQVTQRVGATNQTVAMNAALVIQPRNWKTRVFSLRSLFPAWWRMNPRSLDNVALMQPVEEVSMASRLIYRDLSAQVTGSNTNFTTPEPYAAGSLYPDWDGLPQAGSTPFPFVIETSPSTGVFNFAVAPPINTRVGVYYWKA